jgi:hypothetical protein
MEIQGRNIITGALGWHFLGYLTLRLEISWTS